MKEITGHIHSIQSLGTLDGPGVRFVAFLQGCNLRCGCCHNPDTWTMSEGTIYTPEQLMARAIRYREYWKEEGGITLSGGEPLLQAEFARQVFSLCREQGIHTCLDTSGSIRNEAVRGLLEQTDRVLLDIKYTNDEDYHRYVGCGIETPLTFLDDLQEMGIPVTLRQVIIPTLNDTKENILALRKIAESHPCVDKIELLPFRKICQVKYDKLGMEFAFGHLPEPTRESMQEKNSLLEGLFD